LNSGAVIAPRPRPELLISVEAAGGMTVRHELLEASDAAIDDAIAHADPMVLAGWSIS
jgi:hypothetical protein